MCCSRYVTGNGSFKPSATGGVCCILKVVCPKVHEPRVTNYCAIKDQGEFRREKKGNFESELIVLFCTLIVASAI